MYKIPRLPADAQSPLPPQAAPPAQAASPATAEPPEEHVAGFYSLSVQLTGFDEVELLGTGVGHLYLDWLYEVFPDVTRDLLAAWETIEREHPPGEREAATRGSILDDPELGPFARSVIVLWYAATWKPPAWAGLPAVHPENVDRAFGAAYPEGLMWRAAVGAHPTGAKPTGFGTWAFAPTGT